MIDRETAEMWTNIFAQAGATIIYETDDSARFVNEAKELDVTLDLDELRKELETGQNGHE